MPRPCRPEGPTVEDHPLEVSQGCFASTPHCLIHPGGHPNCECHDKANGNSGRCLLLLGTRCGCRTGRLPDWKGFP